MNNHKNNNMKSDARFFRSSVAGAFLLAASFAPLAAVALEEMGDSALSDYAGQGLLIADKLDGLAGSNHTFYRMALNAELGMNTSIDKLQLGCGGFNDQVVNNACDIDIDYVTMMGREALGQPGAPGAGAAATSQFKLTRPYFEIAVKNDGDPSRREIIGFKIGAAQADGYMAMGRYTAPGSPGASGSCTSATEGAGAFHCNQGINRLSGYMLTKMSGEAFGCFGINPFADCSLNSNIYNQPRVATFNGAFAMWGTRMNRIQTEMTAWTDPATTMGLTLSAPSYVNQSLRFIHGMLMDSTQPEFAADDFFMSFQREAVRYPTYNKTNTHSNAANPGWWMNIPLAQLDGLKAYNVVAGLSSLGGITLTDPDVGQRPPDNCYGALKFC